MSLKNIFIEKPLIIIQSILAFMFFVYFFGLLTIKGIELENSELQSARVVEGFLVLKIEDSIKTKELSKIDKRIYKEGSNVDVLYNNKENYFIIYNFYDYYKGLLYCFVFFVLFSYLTFKDIRPNTKKMMKKPFEK